MRRYDCMHRYSMSTICLLVLIVCLGAGSAIGAAAPSTIRAGYPQLNGGQIPLWNIPEQKLDQKYGLDIKPVYIPGGVRPSTI
jgi:ABC-type nitrate/sulfonate/bicarbonate transport system substrate-binding protein